MALGDGERRVAGDGAEAGNAGGGESVEQHALVLHGSGAIEDGAGYPDAGAPIGEAGDERRNRLALALSIDDEDDGEFEQFGKVGSGAGIVGSAIEEAHDAFDQQQIGPGGLGSGEGSEAG